MGQPRGLEIVDVVDFSLERTCASCWSVYGERDKVYTPVLLCCLCFLLGETPNGSICKGRALAPRNSQERLHLQVKCLVSCPLHRPGR